ncbi:hypothetical protein [Fodinicurvata sp. EGI_FJ10296]|uniref:head-tail joining protein n=1 Tax=Fodinicurvata sp. EGI_FJ10296 TaxID=3231908 RepID=UPI00345635F2
MSWADHVAMANDVCEAAFGREVTYRPAGAEPGDPPLTVVAIFDNEPGHLTAAGTVPISTAEPTLAVRVSTLGREPVRGDRVTVDGQQYKAIDVQPDSAGDGRTLRLHRDADGVGAGAGSGGGPHARRP